MLDGSNYGCSHLHFTGFYGILRYAKFPTSYHELFAKVPRIKCNSHLNSTSFQRNPPYLLLLFIRQEEVYNQQFIQKGTLFPEFWAVFSYIIVEQILRTFKIKQQMGKLFQTDPKGHSLPVKVRTDK